MAQVINTNVLSLNAQRNLVSSSQGMATAIQRLSSGLRINSAKDDAAGLAIATRFGSQIDGLNQAGRNANDAISLAQTAEGAMNETTSILQRIRQLAVQAANGTNTADDRDSIQEEIGQLTAEITRVADTSNFNGIKLLDDSLASTGVKFQIGSDAGQTISVTVDGVTLSALGLAASTATVAGSTADAASALIALIDVALDSVSSSRAKLGAVQNRLMHTLNDITNTVVNLSDARSRLQDTDFASETANLTKYQILQQAGTAMLAQANAAPQSVLSLLK